MSRIIFSTQNINSCKSCGLINPSSFVYGIKEFFENKKYNGCLNRKISIDSMGEIKNCPSMLESYGNIEDKSLIEVLEKGEIKKKWYIKKDTIKTCKECEFRYICTDCRAYIEEPNDIYSKPLKCGYDPEKGEWSEWSTNPLKEKTIEYYGLEELVGKNKV